MSSSFHGAKQKGQKLRRDSRHIYHEISFRKTQSNPKIVLSENKFLLKLLMSTFTRHFESRRVIFFRLQGISVSCNKELRWKGCGRESRTQLTEEKMFALQVFQQSR